MARKDMFKLAYEEVIKEGLINLEFISRDSISYMVKDYPVRIFSREPFRFVQCNCRAGIFSESKICKHHIASLISEFIRVNKLVLIDPNDPNFVIKTAAQIAKEEED